jgi:hypothetical protein
LGILKISLSQKYPGFGASNPDMALIGVLANILLQDPASLQVHLKPGVEEIVPIGQIVHRISIEKKENVLIHTSCSVSG